MSFQSVSSYFLSLILLLGLTSCTNPNVNVDFLAKNIMSSYSFKVTGAVNETDVVPVSANLPLDAECSSSITEVEIQEPLSQEWKKISEVDASGRVACVEEGTVRFSLPVGFVNPEVRPTTMGEKRYNFTLRLTVKNITGEFHKYEKPYVAVFAAPTVSVQVSDLSASPGSAGTHTVTGTCTTGAQVEITSSILDEPVSFLCNDGVFTTPLSPKSGLIDGPANLQVKSFYGDPYYTFAVAEETFIVDRTAPGVSILTPVENAIINGLHLSGMDKFLISGTCEPGLMVGFNVSSGSAPATACPSNGNFTAEVSFLAQGDMTIEAQQTDAVGNVGRSSLRTVKVATQGPEAFEILGVSSFDGEDTDINGVLSGVGLVVKFTTGAKAADYTVQVKDLANNFLCQQDHAATSAGSITSNLNICATSVLNHGQQYKIYITAAAEGNTRTADNNGFPFVVQYPTPMVTAVQISPSSGNFNATNGIGQAVTVKVTYDRAVQVSSGSSMYVLLNSIAAGKKLFYSRFTDSTEKTIEFSGNIVAGEYTTALGFANSMITSGTLVGKNTLVPASRNLLSTVTTTTIDTTAPADFTSISLGTVTPYYDRTPPIQFTLPTDLGVLTVYAHVIDGKGIGKTIGINSGDSITGISLNPGETYTVTVYAKDAAQNKGPETTLNFKSFQCPPGFVYIHNLAGLGQTTPFCVGATEAKEDGSGKITHQQMTGVPKTNVTLSQAKSACSGISASGYTSGTFKLITNSQWNAVADHLANQPINWSGQQIGLGYLSMGYFGEQLGDPFPLDSFNACSPRTCTDHKYRRSMKTSGGAFIYDFSGNAAELVFDTDADFYEMFGGAISTITPKNHNIMKKYGTSQGCSDPSNINTGYSNSLPYCGLGSLHLYCSERTDPSNCSGAKASEVTQTAIFRGGSHKSLEIFSPHIDMAGVFTANRSFATSSKASYVGFRCVYNP